MIWLLPIKDVNQWNHWLAFDREWGQRVGKAKTRSYHFMEQVCLKWFEKNTIALVITHRPETNKNISWIRTEWTWCSGGWRWSPMTGMTRFPKEPESADCKLSFVQGTEVVSAKLFISYMGTNTAKDFKVRKKLNFYKALFLRWWSAWVWWRRVDRKAMDRPARSTISPGKTAHSKNCW